MASFGSTITFKTFITCPSHCFDWLYLVKRIILVLETSCINVKWNSIEPKFFWVGSFWYFCSIFKPAFEVLRCKKSLLVWVAITISLWVKKASHCFTWQTGWFELLLLRVTVVANDPTVAQSFLISRRICHFSLLVSLLGLLLRCGAFACGATWTGLVACLEIVAFEYCENLFNSSFSSQTFILR